MRAVASLAWLTIKGRPYDFIAAFVAVLAGAATITAAGVLLESGVRGGVEPERYAGAAVVVGADQNPPVRGGSATLGERVTLPAGRVDEVASVDGVKGAVGDVGFPVSALTADGGSSAAPAGLPPSATAGIPPPWGRSGSKRAGHRGGTARWRWTRTWPRGRGSPSTRRSTSRSGPRRTGTGWWASRTRRGRG